MPFQIRVAETAGFCFGVRKALDKLLEIRNRTHGPVRTLGPLIHNEQVLEALKNRSVDELLPDEDVSGKHVILRAHGVTPDTRDVLKSRDAVICDATCPKVAQVQAIVKKYAQKGYPVIIIGDKGHAEVDGLLGYAGDRGRVVTGPAAAEMLEGGSRVCVVAQTTQDLQVFNETVAIIKEKFDECFEFNTICDATYERQEETRLLAVQSDAMVIVGGRNSANTKRLYEIAAPHCRSVMIQSASGLDPGFFKDVRRVGVTAGASTPAWVIRDVVDRIHAIGWQHSGRLPDRMYHCVRFLTMSHLTWAAGAAMGYAALMQVVAERPLWNVALIMLLLFWIWRIRGHRLNPHIDLGLTVAASIAAVLPLIIATKIHPAISASAALYFVSMMLTRLFLNDCLNVQADRIAGYRTLPVLLGDRCIPWVSGLTITVMLATSVVLIVMKPVPPAYGLLAAPILNLYCFRFLMRQPEWLTLRANLTLDMPFWFTALSVYILSWFS